MSDCSAWSNNPGWKAAASMAIRRRIYAEHEEARRDVFNYIEMFYNPKRRHSHANDVSPVEFENQYFNRLKSV